MSFIYLPKTVLLLFFLIFFPGCPALDHWFLSSDHSKCEPTNWKEYFESGPSIIEGDIFLPPDIYTDFNEKGLTVSLPTKVWPNGFIPYTIHPLAETENALIHESIALWEDLVNTDAHIYIKFLYFPYKNMPHVFFKNYVVFQSGEGLCYSNVGMLGGEQITIISPECAESSTLHEIGHVLGLWHEQSRSDRDEYIKILWCNIEEEGKYNFTKKTDPLGQDFGDYDFHSIMHYSRLAYSKNGLPTIIPLHSENQFPDEDALLLPSLGDIEAIRALYKRN